MPGTAWPRMAGEPVARWRPRRVRLTIRLRITVLAAAAVTLVLVVTAVALVIGQRRQLTAGLDATLVQRADDLVDLLAVSGGRPDRLGAGQLDGFAQLVGADGGVVAASPNLAGAPAIPRRLDPGQDQAIGTLARLPFDDDRFRVLSRRVDPGSAEGPAVLHVGASLDDIDESTRVLAGTLAGGIPAAVALLTLLVWWLAGRILAPVEGIRAEVARIGGLRGRRRRAGYPGQPARAGLRTVSPAGRRPGSEHRGHRPGPRDRPRDSAAARWHHRPGLPCRRPVSGPPPHHPRLTAGEQVIPPAERVCGADLPGPPSRPRRPRAGPTPHPYPGNTFTPA